MRRSRAPGGRAGGRAERADASRVAADAPRRLRLRPPPLAPSAPRGPPAASRVAEPPAQHGSRAAEPRGRPSTPGSGAGEERGGGARAAGPPGAGETAAAALVRLRARCFLSLGGCGLTPPPQRKEMPISRRINKLAGFNQRLSSQPSIEGSFHERLLLLLCRWQYTML